MHERFGQCTLAAWVPDSFWQSLFLDDHAALSVVWGPIIGPIIAIASFVCSIGNVPDDGRRPGHDARRQRAGHHAH